MTLHFYSPAAYRFVRNKFCLALPSPRTLSGWYSSVNAEPGYIGESFEVLCAIVVVESEKGESVSGCLIIDDMSIKSHLSADSDNLPLAKEACVLMLVLMKKHFKIPLSYFLISFFPSSERAALERASLCKLYDIGVVCASTFDGTYSTVSMGEQLVAKLLVEDPVTHFNHPRDSSKKTCVVLDACHMVKLIRNCLGEKVLQNKNGSIIDWNFVE
ncbi:hypothetical protein PR048_014022 [Dryococelus australis]|uniref:DNA transposase THAP9 n=1 Tax=Dryococelus australis TaxID=614101 RepID=A0ABQ9HTU7_9NEOP|nr:hypothetical protein PR048_014022 [Dryococelus australis]